MIPTLELIMQALEPLVVAWAQYWASQGKDPQAQLQALMQTADAGADAAELAKFGPPKAP